MDDEHARNDGIILVVEDNPDDAELTLHALRASNAADQVEVARDGREALDFIFRSGAPDSRAGRRLALILLDLKIPKIPGLGVLRQLKSDPRTRGIPVVVFTSSSEDQDIQAAFELGANSYIQKPVGFAEFTAAVAQLRSYWLTVNVWPLASSRWVE